MEFAGMCVCVCVYVYVHTHTHTDTPENTYRQKKVPNLPVGFYFSCPEYMPRPNINAEADRFQVFPPNLRIRMPRHKMMSEFKKHLEIKMPISIWICWVMQTSLSECLRGCLGAYGRKKCRRVLLGFSYHVCMYRMYYAVLHKYIYMYIYTYDHLT